MIGESIRFADPRWLWLAALVPLALAALFAWAELARRRQLAKLADPEHLAQLVRSHSPARRRIKEALLIAAALLIGLALARPQWGRTAGQSRLPDEDIVFAIDCSRSMLATDVQPSRLERAKLAVLDFVERHGRGRVGLVSFAGVAFVQCPLTLDYDAFRESLLALDTETIPVPGTDLARALDEAMLAMEKDNRHRIVVLITDGEDLQKGGVARAKAIAEQGGIVFTLGVGTPAGAQIEIQDEQGRKQLMTDARGNPVRSALDESTLRAIAEATRGFYQPLGVVGEGMERVRRHLEQPDRVLPTPPDGSAVERFHLPLALALAALVAELLLGTRRRDPA